MRQPGVLSVLGTNATHHVVRSPQLILHTSKGFTLSHCSLQTWLAMARPTQPKWIPRASLVAGLVSGLIVACHVKSSAADSSDPTGSTAGFLVDITLSAVIGFGLTYLVLSLGRRMLRTQRVSASPTGRDPRIRTPRDGQDDHRVPPETADAAAVTYLAPWRSAALAPPPTTADEEPNLARRMARLARLREQGDLTDAEFRVLASIVLEELWG